MPTRIALRARGNQHYLYSGRSVLVTNLDGWCTGSGTEGFFSDNTRFLSREELTIDGLAPRPAAVSPVESDTSLAYYEAPASQSVPARALYLEVRRSIADGMRAEFRLTNFGRDSTIRARVSIALDADFADTDEAEAGRRLQEAPVRAEWDEAAAGLTFVYCHPRLAYRTRIDVASDQAQPYLLEEATLVLPFALRPRESAEFVLTLTPVIEGSARPAPARVFPAPGGLVADLDRGILAEMPRLTVTDQNVQRAWDTALADLASLPLGLDGTPAVPAAGLPLYQQFFGRDALTMSWQALMAGSRMLRDSLIACAEWQGDRIDDFYDEEPGKMIHQARWGPLSRLKLDAFSRYYGDWATPVDYLVTLGQYLMWTGDRDTVRRLLPAARNVLDWIETYGDLDRDGFLEYRVRSPMGVEHQGWKDSDDAIVDARGEPLRSPVATCEIQGYWYAGLQQAAQAFLACGDIALAARLLARAGGLRKRFEGAFWSPEERFYVMGIGEDGHRADSISSNPGHLLAAGIVSLERARAVATRLLEPDMFSGWGIRTLSSRNPFYNPFSYHRGSVWPVEQGTIAFGLARYGLWDELHRLAKAFFDMTGLFVGNRLPEVVGGVPRDEEHPHPGIYPYSCEPQGWSASAVVIMLQALLGLRPIAPLHLLVVDPHLPDWLPNLELRRLRVGGARVDLRFSRGANGTTRYEVLRTDGILAVIRQTVPSAEPGPIRRAGNLVSSIRGYV